MTSTDPNPPAAPSRAQWELWPVVLGLIALVPTALLVSSLALVIPLPVATVAAAALLAAAQLALVWLLAGRAWPLRPDLVGLRRPRVSWARAAAVTVAALVGSLAFAQLYTMAVTALGWQFLTPPAPPPGLILPGAWALFSLIALAVWTPIAEEVFFRGFVLRGLTNRWPFAPALTVSAAIFAVLHFNPALVIPVFVTGLLLGGLYRYTGSLWPGITAHAAQNALVVLAVILDP